MSARRFLKMPGLGVAAIMAAGFLAGCASIDEVGNSGTRVSGKTGTPISAFANMKPGSEEDFIMHVGRRTYFKANSAVLDSTAKATLDKQAQWLAQYPKWYIKLQGHADDPSNNGKLSSQRADVVMAYLVSRGVSPERMWSKGYGRKRLVQDCPDITCKSQNRRVVSNLREELEDHVIAKRRQATQ